MDTASGTSGRKHRIAIIANGWSSEFLEVTVENIRREAEKDQSDLFIFVTFKLSDNSPAAAKSQLEILDLVHPEDYDGIIMFANTFNSQEEHQRIRQIIESARVPVVSTELHLPGAALVGTSNYQGVYDLACHLIEEHDVKNVVFVSGYEGNEESALRKKALEDALAAHDLKLMDVMPGDFGYYRTARETNKWLDEKKPLPDAFVCANDHMALGLISTLHKRGIEVPRDLIVTGFDQIREAQVSCPIVATVARDWADMAAAAYREVVRQIGHPDPSSEQIFGSRFIPSESCGCEPDEEARNIRLDKMRNHYAESSETSMVDFFFQEVQVAMAKIESKEQFHECAKTTLGRREFFGNDYCICTEPGFFETDDDQQPLEPTCFSEEMDVLYEFRNRESMPLRTFSVSEIYPGYQYEPGKSNVYVFSPMSNTNMVIGYLAIKNYPDILYDLRFKRWCNNMETLLITMRQYIFAQRANRKLREIYMTDFLTGTYNRTGCEKILYPRILAEKAEGNEMLLLFADINCMKVINDEYGHLNGDLAIKATAQALRSSVPKDWLFGRYGGDEFVAVGRRKAAQTIEQYRKKFSEQLEKISKRLKVNFYLTASLGFYIIKPDDTGDIEDYIRKADVSMYEEKELAHQKINEMKALSPH
ncbi:MAG: GGDEF domain-containing protein [Lachnospiraceae bacterium]|nr:GGDEF domain-containing protein [Lachnospiraceae bacterium]